MSETENKPFPQPVTGSTSDTGRVRQNNEDSFWVAPSTIGSEIISTKGWLYIVADGMGGYQGGEVASAIAIKAASDSYYASPTEGDAPTIIESLHLAVIDAQKAVLQHQAEDAEHSQMGSTLVMAVILENDLYVANLGDSRCYRLRDGCLQQMSHDHSWVAEQVRNGLLASDQIHGNLNRNLLTRALGQASSTVKPEIEKHDWRVGDRLLLCSDGLWDMTPDDNIRILLSKPDPGEASSALVDAANAAGGSDNITAVVVGEIRATQADPVSTTSATVPITSVLPVVPTQETRLPRVALIAIIATVVFLLAALIIVSQINLPVSSSVASTMATPAATFITIKPTAVPAMPTATVVEATATAPATVALAPTSTAQAKLVTPTVEATQSVSETIAVSTIVATLEPTALLEATATPLPTPELKTCVTRAVDMADWSKPPAATGVQPVADGIALWGLAHIETNQDLVQYFGIGSIGAPFTITVRALSAVKPATSDMKICFQSDVKNPTCSMKSARTVTAVNNPGFLWDFVYSFADQPTLPQLRIISLAKQKTPLTIMVIGLCQD